MWKCLCFSLKELGHWSSIQTAYFSWLVIFAGSWILGSCISAHLFCRRLPHISKQRLTFSPNCRGDLWCNVYCYCTLEGFKKCQAYLCIGRFEAADQPTFLDTNIFHVRTSTVYTRIYDEFLRPKNEAKARMSSYMQVLTCTWVNGH